MELSELPFLGAITVILVFWVLDRLCGQRRAHRGKVSPKVDKTKIQPTQSQELQPLSRAQLFGLTIALAGLEFVWATQMIFTVPIFERLGLSRRFLGVSWIAGPVSGLFVQPIAGAFSDDLESKWGRRRPFLVGGLLCTLLSMAAFAAAEEIGIFFGDGVDHKSVALAVAIVSSFGDDIAKNAVQVLLFFQLSCQLPL